MSTKNLNLPANSYIPQYHRTFGTVFNHEVAFRNAFQPVQILDGIKQNAIAFTVKTSDTPVVIRAYDKGENVGMGTGTAKSSRFGDITEVKYTDTDVLYDDELTSNDGFDVTTVNEDLDAAVASRFIAISQEQTHQSNITNGEYISTVAGEAKTLDDLTEENVLALFNAIDAYYTDNAVIAPVTAYLRSDLYNAVVDHPLVVREKGSTVDIDGNKVIEFKDFRIAKEPAAYFKDDDVAYFVPDQALIAFVGIVMARVVEPTDYAGKLLQTLSKAGRFILDDNKKAVVKVTMAAVGG